MINNDYDLSTISKITDQIYVSGITPLNQNADLIKQYNIKYILCCVDQNYVIDIHDRILSENPNLTILYLPLDDNIYQNLWKKNENNIKIVKFLNNPNEHLKITKILKIYHHKPMIEIGYNFMNNVITSDQNILVHCMAGASRSISMVIYYLMKKYHIDFDEAMTYVKSKRVISNPNDSFKNQLQQYHIYRDQFTEFHANLIIHGALRK